MNAAYPLPPYRELPSRRLSERKRHLLTAVAVERKPTFRIRRVALLAGAACAAAATALALSLSLSGGSSGPGPRFLFHATHPPVWSAHVEQTGAPTCSALAQLAIGCRGTLTVFARGKSMLLGRARAAGATAISGGTAAQRRILRSILDGMKGSGITQIAIEASDRASLTLRMRATSASGEAYWQEALVAAAFRDLSKMSVALKAGASNGAPLAPTLVRPPRAKPGDLEAARSRFEEAAKKTGSALETLSVYRPEGVAVSAVLEADDPAAFLAHRMPRFLTAIGDPWRDYDGVYIRLVDASGTSVWETSTVVLMSEGSVGSREDLAGCSPVVGHWGQTPPPCPAK